MRINLKPVTVLGGDGMLQRISDDEMLFVPRTIEGSVLGQPWDIEFTVTSTDEHDTPRLTRLTFAERDGGPPIAPDLIRVKGLKLGELMRLAVERGSQPYVKSESGDTWVLPFQHGSKSAATRVFQRGRGKKASQDELQAVVDLYYELRDQPGDTRLAIARALPDKYRMSRATVDRRLKRAEQLGMMRRDAT